jgi:hypothetical protein
MKIIKKFLVVVFCATLTSCHFGPVPKERRMYTVGEIAAVKHLKQGGCDVIYKDSSMIIRQARYPNKFPGLQIGEKYKIAYDRDDYSYIDIYFTEPIIEDTLKYSEGKAFVKTSVKENFYKSNYCNFIYFYEGKRFDRFQYVVGRELKTGDSLRVLINREKPEIAYVKGSSTVTE